MPHVIDPAREHEVIQRASSTFQPRLETCSRLRHDLELHGPASFLLNDGCAVADGAAAHQITDAQLHDVTASQLAVDRYVEQGPISQPLVLVEIEPGCPYIARPERPFGSDVLSGIPGAPFMHGGVEI